jgi:hypothetical protein
VDSEKDAHEEKIKIIDPGIDQNAFSGYLKKQEKGNAGKKDPAKNYKNWRKCNPFSKKPG